MGYIKQLNFDITQSRRIKNYVEQHKLSTKAILQRFKELLETTYQQWKKHYGSEEKISFEEFLQAYLKYAEFSYRLKERKNDLKKVKTHVDILREAIEEYERDYKEIITIENIVNTYFSEQNED